MIQAELSAKGRGLINCGMDKRAVCVFSIAFQAAAIGEMV